MRRVFVQLALVGFICRALVPVGFMPVPLSEGGPIRLCHGGAAGVWLAAVSDLHVTHQPAPHGADAPGPHSHDPVHSSGEPADDHDAVHEGWERCPVGAAFAFAFLTSDPALAVPAMSAEFRAAPTESFLERLVATSYQARAPPLV